jgi:hypothetical protein
MKKLILVFLLVSTIANLAIAQFKLDAEIRHVQNLEMASKPLE